MLLFNLARSNASRGGIFLLPANICPAVPLALAAAARGFEFVDIDPVSLGIDWQGVRKRSLARGGPPVAALVYVRTYGADSDASQFFREVNALDKNVCLIDDRCLSPPESEPEQVDWQGDRGAYVAGQRNSAAVQNPIYSTCASGARASLSIYSMMAIRTFSWSVTRI